MTRSEIVFLTHPEVQIDPQVPVPDWGLAPRGLERMHDFVRTPQVEGLGSIFCSTERKAIETAACLAEQLGLAVEQLEELGENDRSATGYLPAQEFQAHADEFFARPEESVGGWERAVDAQARILAAVQDVDRRAVPDAHVAVVAHGGVGTLLLCHAMGEAIDRRHDQPHPGGGCLFRLRRGDLGLIHGWQAI